MHYNALLMKIILISTHTFTTHTTILVQREFSKLRKQYFITEYLFSILFLLGNGVTFRFNLVTGQQLFVNILLYISLCNI